MAFAPLPEITEGIGCEQEMAVAKALLRSKLGCANNILKVCSVAKIGDGENRSNRGDFLDRDCNH